MKGERERLGYNRKRFGLVAISVAALVVLGVGLGVGLGSTGGRATDDQLEQVKESVSEFEGGPVPGLELMPAQPGSDRIEVTDGRTIYVVNSQTTRVEFVTYADNYAGNQELLITEQQAVAIATEFAQEHCDNFSIFTGLSIELKGFDLGEEYFPPGIPVARHCAYDVTWNQVIDGLSTPNIVWVSVNPGTGKVMAYSYHYQPLESPGPPSISQEEAVATVKDDLMELAVKVDLAWGGTGEVNVEGFCIKDGPELMIRNVPFHSEKTYLVWRVEAEVEGYAGCGGAWGQYYIDACTGDVLMVFRH